MLKWLRRAELHEERTPEAVSNPLPPRPLDPSSAGVSSSSAAQAVPDPMLASVLEALERLAAGDVDAAIATPALPSEAVVRLKQIRAWLEEELNARSAVERRVARQAAGISAAVSKLSARAEKQADDIQRAAGALGDVTNGVRQAAESAAQARAIVSEANNCAAQSSTIMARATGAMEDIERASRQIGQLVGVIDEIALQTNMLALNAGIEAARAGQAGAGFAVIAQDVRALAQRTAGEARQIRTLLESSSGIICDGARLVVGTGDAVGEIMLLVEDIDVAVATIVASAQEQAARLASVNDAVADMKSAIVANAGMFDHIGHAVEALRDCAA